MDIFKNITLAFGNILKPEQSHQNKSAGKIKNHEDFFRNTLDNLLEGCQIISFDWRYIYLNNAAEIHNRCPNKQLLGKKYMDMWPGIEKTEIFRLIRDCLEHRIYHHFENKFVFPDETIGWFDLSIQPVPEGVFILSIDITERLRSESVLRKSEENYHTLFDNMLNGFAYCHMLFDEGHPVDFIYINVNKAFESLTGLKDIIGKKASDVIPGIRESDANLIETYGRVALTGNPETFEVFVKSLNDWYSVSVYSPEKEYFISVFDVITERKLAEESLRKSEDLFNKAFHGSPSPMTIARQTDGSYIAVNDSFLRLIELIRDEVIGRTGQELSLIDAEERKSIRHQLIEHGSLHDIEVKAISKSGKQLYLLTSIENTNLAGEPCTITTMLDITARKEAEEALKKSITQLKKVEKEIIDLNKELETRVLQRTADLAESEERFRQLSEAAYEAIIIHEDGVLLRANDQFFNLFGYKSEELLGKQVMSMTTARESLEILKKQIESSGFGPYLATGLRKDGTTFPMEVRARKMEYEGRTVRVAAIRDITLNKKAEAELRDRTLELETANKELEAFTYSVSHDLRAPLRSINGFTQVLIEDYSSRLDDEGRRVCSVIQENSKKMGQLIDDLLAFSRIGRSEMVKSLITMKSLVYSIVNELIDSRSRDNIKISIGNICDTPGDPTMIRQVWTNLLSNAIKYSSKKKRAII
jgi:PAS domain S-box-containing protein